MGSSHIGLCEYKLFDTYNFMNRIYGTMTNQRQVYDRKIGKV